MKSSIANVSISGNLETKLRAVADAGFSGVEIFENDLLSFPGSPRDAWGLVRDVDHPNIGLILDSFHSLSRKIPSSGVGDIRADKLLLVQVADAPTLDMDYLSRSRHFRCMPG